MKGEEDTTLGVELADKILDPSHIKILDSK